jgi:hypothetical protein
MHHNVPFTNKKLIILSVFILLTTFNGSYSLRIHKKDDQQSTNQDNNTNDNELKDKIKKEDEKHTEKAKDLEEKYKKIAHEIIKKIRDTLTKAKEDSKSIEKVISLVKDVLKIKGIIIESIADFFSIDKMLKIRDDINKIIDNAVDQVNKENSEEESAEADSSSSKEEGSALSLIQTGLNNYLNNLSLAQESSDKDDDDDDDNKNKDSDTDSDKDKDKKKGKKAKHDNGSPSQKMNQISFRNRNSPEAANEELLHEAERDLDQIILGISTTKSEIDDKISDAEDKITQVQTNIKKGPAEPDNDVNATSNVDDRITKFQAIVGKKIDRNLTDAKARLSKLKIKADTMNTSSSSSSESGSAQKETPATPPAHKSS